MMIAIQKIGIVNQNDVRNYIPPSLVEFDDTLKEPLKSLYKVNLKWNEFVIESPTIDAEKTMFQVHGSCSLMSTIFVYLLCWYIY